MSSYTSHPGSHRMLRRLLALASAAALVGGLAACAPPEKSGGTGGHDGGTLTIGIPGDSSETLDPHTGVSAQAAEERYTQLYDPLTRVGPKGDVQWALATGMDHNDDLTRWTVHLRKGVTFHDGSAFGADDVIFSVKRILDPKRAASGAPLIQDVVDPDGIKKVDDHTVRFTLKKAYGPFKEMWASVYLMMVPTDFDPAHPVGTGAFEYVKASPGQQSTFTRYDGYWGVKPKFETLKVVDFASLDAAVNALQGGQIDVAAKVPFSRVDSLKGGGIKILTSKSAYHLIMFFRQDIPPFNDPKVMKAVKLLVNRKQVVENAFDGHGDVANDINYRGTAQCGAPDVPQRSQDLAKAKKLLAEAGQSDLHFTIATGPGQPGMLELGQVVQQNAKKAGVTVKVNQLDTAGFLAKWGEWDVGIGYSSAPYLTVVKDNLLPGAGSNAAHFDDKEFNSLASELYETVDPGDQCDIMHRMQKIEWERGGDLIPAWTDLLTAHTAKVKGLKPVVNGYPLYHLGGVSVSD